MSSAYILVLLEGVAKIEESARNHIYNSATGAERARRQLYNGKIVGKYMGGYEQCDTH